jgi:dTMP kinase
MKSKLQKEIIGNAMNAARRMFDTTQLSSVVDFDQLQNLISSLGDEQRRSAQSYLQTAHNAELGLLENSIFLILTTETEHNIKHQIRILYLDKFGNPVSITHKDMLRSIFTLNVKKNNVLQFRVAVCGLDGSGKTTQIELLKSLFPGWTYVEEPTDKVRELVTSDALASDTARTLMMMADRAEQYHLLSKSKDCPVVVSSRSIISGYAYSKMNDSHLLQLCNMIDWSIDLVILLSMDRETLEHRLSGKQLDAVERRDIDDHLNIQERMRSFISRNNLTCIEIDADQDIDIIHTKIVSSIPTAIMKPEFIYNATAETSPDKHYFQTEPADKKDFVCAECGNRSPLRRIDDDFYCEICYDSVLMFKRYLADGMTLYSAKIKAGLWDPKY